MKKIILHSFIFLLTLSAAQGQEMWTVNKCVQYAIENNLNYKSYDLSVKSERMSAAQSKYDLLPSVSASTSGGMSYGRSLDNSTNRYTDTEHFSANGSIGANLNIFRGFSKLNRMAYTKFRLQAAEWNKLNYQDDLAFDVLSTYYDVVFYAGLVSIAKDQLEISEYNLKKTNAQVEIGLQAKSDLLQMQAALEREKLNIIMAQNKLDEIKYRLWEQMNFSLGQTNDFDIDYSIHPKLILANPQSDSVFHVFSEFSPLLKKGQADLLAAEKNVAITKGFYYPSVNLNASVGSRFNDTDIDDNGNVVGFPTQFDNNLNKYVGASISIPIFNRNQQRTRVKQAKISHEQVLNDYEEQKLSLYYQIANDTRELQALQTKYVQTEKKLKADNLAYEVALKKYNEGLINVIELLTVKDRLVNSESQLLLAQIQYQIKSKTLEFYLGNRFWQ
ncbi:TolC family protein [Labilibacter marinus]|uniref:TolC family protein n=1 Tax=Labilibacter marinus TaxID=1477105 RepID=UPI0008324648|nr:TolC family protein [Labilibacter marinus]